MEEKTVEEKVWVVENRSTSGLSRITFGLWSNPFFQFTIEETRNKKWDVSFPEGVQERGFENPQLAKEKGIELLEKKMKASYDWMQFYMK